jgi:hypothetical protein
MTGRDRGPHVEEERRLIRAVLVVGSLGGVATWIAAYAVGGAVGLYVLLAICILVCAAWAREVGA